MNKNIAKKLHKIIAVGEDYLIDRILYYSKKQGYVKYTSTLKEAWRMSISGLSEVILYCLENRFFNLEMEPDENYLDNYVAAFGIKEAKLHRTRGITLSMFLGLMKYYRQSYLDLAENNFSKIQEYKKCIYFLIRVFDKIEIGFCSEWSGINSSDHIAEMQNKNRFLANEKNKYLTVFESQPNAVILVVDDLIDNMNFEAVQLFENFKTPGISYYGNSFKAKKFTILTKELKDFQNSSLKDITFEKTFKTFLGNRVFQIKFKKMLDVSEKFSGVVIILTDLTDLKNIQKELEYLSMHDQLTGLYNRFYLEDYVKRIKGSRLFPVSIISCDIDGLKPVNDNLGHIEGDRLLINCADILKESVRKSDIVTRTGGDEFVIILPLTNRTIAKQRIDFIKKNIKNYNADNASFPLSISIGYETAEDTNADLEKLLNKADLLMYKNKTKNKKIK